MCCAWRCGPRRDRRQRAPRHLPHPADRRRTLNPAASELVNDFTGVFKTVPLDTVVDELVRGIERRSRRTVIPRQHRPTALVPGLAQALVEGLAFRPKTIARAIELGSIAEPTAVSTPPSR